DLYAAAHAACASTWGAGLREAVPRLASGRLARPSGGTMNPVILAMPGNERVADALAAVLSFDRGAASVRRFPDGESHVRVESPLEHRHALIVCTLDRPDDKLVALLLLASAARDSGARSIGLVAPYPADMRQDHRSHPGETLSTGPFAASTSRRSDWPASRDPPLPRITEL